MLSDCERQFLAHQRVAYLATADSRAVPHVVPVCFAIVEHTLYITIDEKPKRLSSLGLKRLRNIAENPAVAVVVDRYDEDWARLGWVMLRGSRRNPERRDRTRAGAGAAAFCHPQLRAMEIAQYPVIAVRIKRTTSWGDLSVVSGV
jgi:PPOX class probable F420-dependent enzyme